jgi:hypothetical protein
MTVWTDFIKTWAAQHNVSYGCAMSDPKLGAAYRQKYPKPAPKMNFKKALKKGLPKEPKAPTKKALKGQLAKSLSKPAFVDEDGNEVFFD